MQAAWIRISTYLSVELGNDAFVSLIEGELTIVGYGLIAVHVNVVGSLSNGGNSAVVEVCWELESSTGHFVSWSSCIASKC